MYPRIHIAASRRDRIYAYAEEVERRKTYEDDKDWDDVHRIMRFYRGFLAELVVSDYYNVPYYAKFYPDSGDEGSDITVNGLKLGVKATTFTGSNPFLLVKKGEKKAADYYILVRHWERDKYHGEILGWIDKDTALNRRVRKIASGGPLNYVVERKELKPIETLMG